MTTSCVQAKKYLHILCHLDALSFQFTIHYSQFIITYEVMHINLDRNDKRALYLQIAEALKQQIECGDILHFAIYYLYLTFSYRF